MMNKHQQINIQQLISNLVRMSPPITHPFEKTKCLWLFRKKNWKAKIKTKNIDKLIVESTSYIKDWKFIFDKKNKNKNKNKKNREDEYVSGGYIVVVVSVVIRSGVECTKKKRVDLVELREISIF